jgi:hypothetical protein
MSVVDELLRQYGRTYAEDAGIRLTERPGPLYQLLVLSTVLSARISADIAVAAARELNDAGCSSPRGMLEASWQDRVDALGRAHYRRYDERTATMLGDGAGLLLTKYRGDLRRLRDAAECDAGHIGSLLTEFPGIGPAGASIFLREVQEAWPCVCPYVDNRMLDGARRVGLPDRTDTLAPVVASSPHPASLAAALVRVSFSRRAVGEITSAARR